MPFDGDHDPGAEQSADCRRIEPLADVLCIGSVLRGRIDQEAEIKSFPCNGIGGVVASLL